jgi:hypothetical protein
VAAEPASNVRRANACRKTDDSAMACKRAQFARYGLELLWLYGKHNGVDIERLSGGRCRE